MFSEEKFAAMRDQMVEEQLASRGIHDERVQWAMGHVPRHLFVPQEFRHMAYQDGPLPIGENQTISQPFIVAAMTQMLRLHGDERVLEIGTGCGYQTAILCELSGYVYSLERYALLADKASRTLHQLGYENIDIHIGDGSQGLVDMALFDAIIVTAAAPSLPGPLCSQLSPQGGRMVIPVGDQKNQRLHLVYREGDHFSVKKMMPVRFVPLVGKYGFKDHTNDDRAQV